MIERLKQHPVLDIKRGRKIKFWFDGREITAYEGETITAALYASGIMKLRESTRFKRPRGFFCAIGKCSSCLMKVNGKYNVRTCITLAEDGMVVETQKGKGNAGD